MHYMEFIHPLKAGTQTSLPATVFASYQQFTNNLPTSGRVTNSRAPQTSESLSEFVVLKIVPCPQMWHTPRIFNSCANYGFSARHTHFGPTISSRDLSNRQNTFERHDSAIRTGVISCQTRTGVISLKWPLSGFLILIQLPPVLSVCCLFLKL